MAAFTKILGRRDKSVVPLPSMYFKYDKNAQSMYGCECHAAIAKPAAAVTRVQSPSQEVGSGDNGLGLLCFDLSSAETDFWWPEDEQCRGFASSLHEKCKTLLNKNTHGMYGAACDSQASAAVTHVQSQSQDVGSGDKGLGVFMFRLCICSLRLCQGWGKS